MVDVFATLDGNLPYILQTGNHDYTPVRLFPLDEHRETTLLNDYFTGITHPGMVEMVPGKLENTYTLFRRPRWPQDVNIFFGSDAAYRDD